MCQSSKDALLRWHKIVQNAENRIEGDKEMAEHNACKKDALGNIVCFSNCLSNCPSAAKMWLDSLKNKEDSTSKATANIAELKSTLATLPSFSDKIEVLQRGHKKDDDECMDSKEDKTTPVEDEAGQKIQTLKQMQKEFGATVASIRSSVKVIALALESQKGAGLSLKGVPCDVSSKTD